MSRRIVHMERSARHIRSNPAAACATEVRWLPAFIAKFERNPNRLAQSRAETGEQGLLLGGTDPDGVILVSDFEPCDVRSPQDLAAASMRRKLDRACAASMRDSVDVVGFYRICGDPAAEFGESDIALIRTHFSAPANVFLLASTGHAARSYLWRNRTLVLHQTELRFSGRDGFDPAPASEPPGAPAPVRTAPGSRGRLAARVIVGILLAAGAAVMILRHQPEAPGGSRLPDRDMPRSPSLGLKVATAGQSLNVSWNPESPALKSCRFARLSITDGISHREITLTPPQIVFGSVTYQRITDTVEFRLEAIGERGLSGSEMLVAIGRAPSPPPELAVLPPPLPMESRFVPARPITQVQPTLPDDAHPSASSVTVSVRVAIDESGSVTKASPVSEGPVEWAGLYDAAVRAARLWKFQPARRGDRAVATESILVFRFAPSPQTAP